MEHNEHFSPEQDSFQTGSTNPPKKRGGIIAVLLVTVIFLGGFTRALSILNIRLFANQPSPNSSFLTAHKEPDETCAPGRPDPGFTGQTVSDLHQRFYQHPAGILVEQVTPGSSAEVSGVTDGDILLTLDGTPSPDTQTLDTFLLSHQPGDRLEAVFYRDGRQYTCTLTLTASN